MPIRLNIRMISTLIAFKMLQQSEIENDDDADEDLEDQQELALRDADMFCRSRKSAPRSRSIELCTGRFLSWW